MADSAKGTATRGAEQLRRQAEVLQQGSGDRLREERDVEATAGESRESTFGVADKRLDAQELALKENLHKDCLRPQSNLESSTEAQLLVGTLSSGARERVVGGRQMPVLGR